MTTTTTTVAIGAGGGGLALAAAGVAVAGAVGLGLAGVASIFAGRGGGNGGGRKKYKHRYHRDVSGRSHNLERMMELIRREDVTDCGLKLMCDLAAENREDLLLEELGILDLVGPALSPDEDVSSLGALGEYREAKAVGQFGGNCSQRYFLCPLNGEQLMEAVMQFLP